MDYRSVIESKYNRQNWQALLYDIFRNKVQFWQQPQPVPVDKDMAKRALYTGKITLPDGHVIAIYEVELSDSVIIERNRAGIRNLLLSSWRGMGCSGAFMFCFRQNEAVLRFSYVSESFAFAEDGSLTKESTDTKRFTYLLGEGHRSRTAIMQFEDLKKSALDLKAITKAFSVEALSDLFFKEYKKQYEDIIEFITGKRMVKVANKWEEQVTGQPCREIMQEFSQFPDAEKAVRDYVKKLMGRLVFIQFLQKKGWMGCSAGESWKDGDKEFVQNLFANTSHKNTFVDDVLEPLFNDINTKRPGDITSSPNVGSSIKIPYLNGGLFEKDDYDKTNFALPAKFMKNLLDFFASYNFTIDENDPDDAEIGVDPEMLGRIFENLLEDNKDKGAFYTPKEIVQYMCRESLIAYLQTDVNDDQTKDTIRQFVTTYDASILSKELKESVDQKLKDVKICDPAIGSGAFPMGLLRELYACRKAIEGIDEETAVSIKTHIIQNNIYGVDIEKGAVDIARLRFWLALIVDEKNPHALPNMDFKIMQGNSLLEQYEGVELSGMSLDEQKKKKTKKGQSWQAKLAFDEKYALDNIQHAIKEYYLTDDHKSKLNLRSIINDNVRSYIINLKGCTPDVQRKIEEMPIPNDKFFLWHIYFKEVFENGGFDIVIGNPPYIQLQSDIKSSVADESVMKLGDLYKSNNFSTYSSEGDIYCLFYEQGLNLLSSGGHLCYITSNKWMRTKYGELLRTHFSKYNPKLLIDFTDTKVFQNAEVDVNILLIEKNSNKLCTNACVINKHCNLSRIEEFVTNQSIMTHFADGSMWMILTGNAAQILRKVNEKGKPLESWNIKFNRGLTTGFNKAFIISDSLKISILESCSNEDEYERTKTLLRPILRGKDIIKYSYEWGGMWIINTHNGLKGKLNRINVDDYPAVKAFLSQYKDKLIKRADQGDTPYNLRNCAYLLDFEKKKICWNRISKDKIFSLVDEGVYIQDSMHFITGNHLEYLLATLNSKLFQFIMSLIVGSAAGGNAGNADNVKKLNIIEPSEDVEHNIKLYLSSYNYKKIDNIIYELYGLTEEEIAIVEGTK